jgi:preprotein translocase subunit SecA
MVMKLLSKIFGTRNERLIARMSKVVSKINSLEPAIKALSDDQLKAKTAEFRQRLGAGSTLHDILPEAFAVVREASVRTLGLRHFDVQLIGGMALHDGKIAEMRMGEGKTLVATLPAYLNALAGRGLHIITVNDYLANRDAEWMKPIYDFLGLTVGVNLTNMPFEQKKAAYLADITYGTNNEFGFDYLRDNMSFNLEGRVQRDLHYAIVDEVDCILIDEARTPLIISGPADESSDLYTKINSLIPKLAKQAEENGPGDFKVDEKTKQVYLTEDGHTHVEELLHEAGLVTTGTSLYDVHNIILMHHVNAALRAHAIYNRDIDYVVKNDEVIIVDEHTGRMMEGRRWSEGLHQAVEAKEGVKIRSENQTLATITFQNYFRLFEKLAGMTGTADTEAYEFAQIYGLEVLVIPTNQPVVRIDRTDVVFLTQEAKYNAIVKDIIVRHEKGQPILVGTTSIDSSEHLSSYLQKHKIPHQVLNAKYHEKEAKIISQAGRPGAVTIATNMAGRGTDIVLGGDLASEIAALENPTAEQIAALRADWQQRHDQVVAAGGLHVLGTERNESRRIDNQLRGRSGRQGDPGSSQYYLSLEDNLMRIFASDRLASLMGRLGMEADVPIENTLVSRSIANAQRKVEGHNFDIRKQLLKFDDVANDQRKVIYSQRYDLMSAENIHGAIEVIREDAIGHLIDEYIPPESMEDMWDTKGLEEVLAQDFGVQAPIREWLDSEDELHEEALKQRIQDLVKQHFEEREQRFTPDIMYQIEKTVMLRSLDSHWKEHLASMDALRQGIHLRGYAQKDPAQEYKREAFIMFSELLDNVKRDVVSVLSTIELRVEEPVTSIMPPNPQVQNLQFQHAPAMALTEGGDGEEEVISDDMAAETFFRQTAKVGRNDPCPCNSGKKYKQCHGVL